MSTIAFIGTGNMGAPMACNLAKAGHRVQAFDIVNTKLEPLAAEGVLPSISHKAALNEAEFIILMLPSGSEVSAVIHQHILPQHHHAKLLIDASTIDLQTAQSLHKSCAAQQLNFIDAPVSGGVPGAQQGKLSFMVGGSTDNFQHALPVLQAMGQRIIHCGDGGLGQSAKMCNNLMLAIQLNSLCEGFLLAERVGLSAEVLYDVAESSSSNCFSLSTFCPVPHINPQAPSSKDYQPGFMSHLMLKDLNIALAAAAEVGITLGAVELCRDRYQKAVDAGDGERDFSHIYTHLSN